MKSAAGSEPLDLERLQTAAADVRAPRRARQQPPMETEHLLRALGQLRPPPEALRQRRGPRGEEPFRL
jgi:hypothetical protein